MRPALGGSGCWSNFSISLIDSRGCAALACGTERWPAKVGTDRDARKVANLPQATTIEQLISIAAPAHPETRRSARFAPTELTTFQIKGVLKIIKKKADQDYILSLPIRPI
jgi:hypothetical protein